jgi:hypothetical protein
MAHLDIHKHAVVGLIQWDVRPGFQRQLKGNLSSPYADKHKQIERI